MRLETWATLLICTAAAPAGAAAASLPWKLTLGEYAYNGYYGSDVNLRWRANDSSAWVGAYSDPYFGTQARAGADTSIDAGKYLQTSTSIRTMP